MTVVALISATAETAERDSAAAEAIVRVLPRVGPEDLAIVLRAAPTRERRALLSSLGLSYKRLPSPAVVASLLELVRSDSALRPRVGQLVAQALHQRLHAALDGAGPDVADADADALVRWLAQQFTDVAPPVLAWAFVHHALRHPTTSALYPAMLLHLVRQLPGLWDDATGELETLIAQRSLDLFDDAPLRFAERLVEQVDERHPETVEKLGRVVAFTATLDGPELLVQVIDELESLASFAQVQQTMLDTLAEWRAGEAGAEDVTRVAELREVVAELTPARPDPDLEDLLRLDGPVGVADDIARLRDVVQVHLEAGDAASSALAGFAAVVRGESDDVLAALDAFSDELPELRRLAFTAASQDLTIAAAGAPPIVGPLPTDAIPLPPAPVGVNGEWMPFADAEGDAAAKTADTESAGAEIAEVVVVAAEEDTADSAECAGNVEMLGAADRVGDREDDEDDEDDVTGEDTGPDARFHAAAGGNGQDVPNIVALGSPDAVVAEEPWPGQPSAGEGGSDGGELVDAIDLALRESRFGLAHHLAIAAGNVEQAAAFGLAALCVEARTATGPCVVRFKEEADGVVGLGDLASRIVLLAATTRMSLVAPHSGASSLVAALAAAIDGFQELADAVVSAAQQGVALVDDVLAAAGTLEEADRAVEAATDAVRHFLHTAPSKTIKYQRATDVWVRLVGNGGVLRDLLTPIVDVHRSEEPRRVATQVRERAVVLRSPKAYDAEVKATNNRRHKQNIHSGAAEKLRAQWDETLTLAETWSDAVMAADRAHNADGRMWQQTALDALRSANERSAQIVDEGLEQRAASGTAVVAGAARAAYDMLVSVRSMLSGEPPEGPEPSADRALNAELVADPTARLDESFSVMTTGDDAGLARIAREPALDAVRAAYDQRAAVLDHVGTGLVVEMLADAGQPDAPTLAERRDAELAIGREAVRESWRSAIDRLASDRRLGFLDETVYSAWNGEMLDADPSGRNDLDTVQATIETIVAKADEHRVATLDEFKLRLEQLAAEQPTVASARQRILERVDDGDLATAEEYMAYARDGEAIPEPDPPPEGIEVFYPAVDVVLTEVDLARAAAGEVVAAGGAVGPLDFGSVQAGDLRVLDAGFKQWRELARVRQISEQVQWESHLPPILQVLGCAANRLVRRSGRRGEHQWVDLEGFSILGGDRDPLVPAFAPDPGSTTVRKLLVVAGDTSADALDGIVGREGPGTPVIVLYPDALGPERRRRVAEVFHRQERAVAVIDANLFAWIATKGGRRFGATMRAVLPFVRTNPYQRDAYGLVPPSMFYGRDDELRKILKQDGGTSYVYGGRQLGKSALLRQAHRDFNAQPNQAAVYVDLKVKQVGQPRPASDVWEELWEPLRRAGVVADAELPAARLATRISESITRWLDDVPGRRLLLLLDEADKFLESDLQQSELGVSGQLKGLMEETNRRCKIVFAGLHTVQRFASVAPSAANNPPVVHLGEPLAIGPLDGRDAADLVSRPTWALGWQFASADLVNRILAHTNRQPALIVIFMYHLLERVAAKPRGPGEPPSTITAADVDAVWADPPVTRAILERVRYTLDLDPAYSVISHVVAYNHHLPAGAGGVPAAELRDQCVERWPAGFGQMLLPDFQLIADEMIGLGVLAKEGNTYRLRSPNVARLLGSKDDIEAVLDDAHKLEPTAKFEPARWRREVQPTSGAPAFRSPLSDAQLADLCAVRFQTRIVAATAASGLAHVPETIAAAHSPRSTHHTVHSWNEPKLAARYFRPLGDGRHRAVTVMLNGAPHLKALELVEAAAVATTLQRRRRTGADTLAITFVAHATKNGPLLRTAGAGPLQHQVPIVAAGPWTVEAIVNFGRDASGVPFDTRTAAERVHDATGGWDVLVASAAAQLARGVSLEDALARLPIDQLDAQIDVTADPVLEAAWREAYDGGLCDMSADPELVAEYLHGRAAITAAAQAARGSLGVADTADGTSLVTHLLHTGLLVDTGDGVTVEPVAARLHF